MAEGVWDIDDLHRRTDELAAFVARAREMKLGPLIAVGYSNGANIAWSLLLRRPDLLAGAVLMRAMLPFDPQPVPKLGGVPVLLLASAADPVVPAPQRDRLAALLKQAGADVTYHVIPAGHGLTERDLDLVREWLTSAVVVNPPPRPDIARRCPPARRRPWSTRARGRTRDTTSWLSRSGALPRRTFRCPWRRHGRWQDNGS